jgi:hypothetical protein
MRVPAEDRRQVQTEIDGRRYTARGGFFEMPEHDARIHMQSANYGRWGIAGVPRPKSGYRCPDCSFGSFFKTCSRCGAECVREGADARSAA